jgi:hypothetical protein
LQINLKTHAAVQLARKTRKQSANCLFKHGRSFLC